MKRKREGAGMRPVRNLFGDILPPDYRQRTATINQFQAFFSSLEDDPVYACVEVLSVDHDSLTLAVPSPGLVNYLRLHTREISGMLEQNFGRRFELRMIVQPGAARVGAEHARQRPARHFSDEVSKQVERSANGLEDEALKEALTRLSRSIRER